MDNPQIQIQIDLDEKKVPEKIIWTSSSLPEPKDLDAKAMLLSFWDSKDKTAMRLDLWTKTMMVDEMADFFYQTFLSFSDTYHRSVPDSMLHEDIKKFAHSFKEKFKQEQVKNTP